MAAWIRKFSFRISYNSTVIFARMASKKCIFCDIIADKDEKTAILYKDDSFVAFRDIRPAAQHHYLIVPRQHISDAKALDESHRQMVETLVQIGTDLLRAEKGEIENARFGFHWPPFHAISHLHLHVISPISQLSFLGRIIFRPNSWWFVTPKTVLDQLKKLPENKS